MKKIIWWIVGSLLFLGSVGGVTAGIIVATHEHKYSVEWKYDEINHWHEATCSHEEQISDLTEHCWDDGVVTDPTCTSKGYTTYTCSVCGATKTGNVTEMLGHNWDDGVVTYSTCTTLGNFTKTCTVCDGKDVMPFSEYGDHIYSSDWVITDTHHYRTSTCPHSSEKFRNEEHTYLTYYEDVDGTLMKHKECNICHHEKTVTPMVSGVDYVEYTYEEANATGGTTLSSPNTLYVLTGDYATAKTFTLNAENITVIGSKLISTTKISFRFSENSNGATIYGFKDKFGGASNFVSDVTFIDCNFNDLYITFRASDVDIAFDNCYMTGAYALYFEYFKTTPNCTVSITNCTIDAIEIYSIFFYGCDGSLETGFPTLSKIIYENNSCINGWGTADNNPKRAVFKFHHDQQYALGDNGNTTDTSKLTADAKAFAEYVLTSGNTFDKAGREVAIFNFDNIYFSDIDWKYWTYE